MTSLLKPQRPPGDSHAAQQQLVQQMNPRTAKMLSSYQQLEAALKMNLAAPANPFAALHSGGNNGKLQLGAAVPSPRAVVVAGSAASEVSPRAAPVKLNPKALPLPPPPPPPPVQDESGKPSHFVMSSAVLGAERGPQSVEKEGLQPQAALARYASVLTAYERSEILGYPQVYFVGENARKLESNAAAPNNGYDDDKSDYRVVVDDHIGYRYQVLNELGRGSFGQVSKALDHKTKTFVALKIIKNKKKFHDQAAIEANILKHLRDNDPLDKMHIVRMVDNFIFRNHMIITFELHGMNLYELCKMNKFAPLSIPTIKTFTKQLLVALNYTAMHKIVHCDLKPENILLKQNSKSHIKVIDYGSSCFENQRLYTYIQSRFYRAPEVMLGIPYTPAIDMWSLGCILAELANGYPIFPGETEVDQMACVMEYLGVPPRSLVEKGSRKKLFFDANGLPKLCPNSRGKTRRPGTKELAGFLRSGIVDGDVHFSDFVARALAWDPASRMTPAQAMAHPWICAMFDEPTVSKPQQLLSAAGADNRKQCILPQLPQSARRPAN
jgi:dual specificity tyrosine-phosphorylation-regulated kinase 2/3/4